MAIVTLGDLGSAITLTEESARSSDNSARNVVFARSLAGLEEAEPGDVVVLDEPLGTAVGTYHFDLALGAAQAGVSAIVLPRDSQPSITGQRLATTRRIALAHLVPGNDVATISALVQQAQNTNRDNLASLLHAGCTIIDGLFSIEDIDRVLGKLATLFGVEVAVETERQSPDDLQLRVRGVDRGFLRLELEERQPLVHALRSHLARTIEEAMLRSDADLYISEATRAALLNELLLGDAGTSADSASRLRRAAYPIDGSHAAIRLDCHDPVPSRRHAAFAVKQRLAALVADQLRGRRGTWARAGTDNSIIIVVSTRDVRPDFDQEVRAAARELTLAATELIDDLELYVGIGGTHVGIDGLPQSVMEATTAARSARTREIPNVPQHIDRLGLSRALVHWSEIDGVRPVLDEILGPIESFGRVKSDVAISTLKIYLDSGRNVNLTARNLGIHRNTARYRIDRIVTALNVDLEDPEERLLVELACRVRESRRSENV